MVGRPRRGGIRDPSDLRGVIYYEVKSNVKDSGFRFTAMCASVCDVPRKLSNYDALGSLERRRTEAGVSLGALAVELQRARQAVAVLEQRDRIAPERVRPISRERYVAALGELIARQRQGEIDAGLELVAFGEALIAGAAG